MKNNLTEIVFILDRSGSMYGLEADTIGGFNTMLEKQKREDGKALVSTILFDHERKVLHDRKDVQDISPLTEADYTARGTTALLDAIGESIRHVKNIHKYIRPEDVPERTLFVIATDGQENNSEMYSYKQIQQMIHEQEKQGWEFLFLGANIDAAKTARSLGIRKEHAADYHADSQGTQVNFAAMSDAISTVRSRKTLRADWKQGIEKDFSSRGRGKRGKR